jgi:hypothetical protein
MNLKPTEMNCDDLPIELRLYALGLYDGPLRGVGRPRRLDYQGRLEIYVAWWGALNAHAVHVHDRKRDRAVAKLQTRFRTLSAAGTPTHETVRITTAIDKIGRVSRVPIEPPPTCYPELDKAIAEQFSLRPGFARISPRMVRRIRSDRRLEAFKPQPAWLERPWEKPTREAFQARQVAKRLMTPERYNKGEAIVLEGGRLVVLDTAGRLNQRGLLSDSALHRYRDFERRAVKAGMPFKVGTEREIIPGPAPRHRVGCENFRSEWYGYQERGAADREGPLRRWLDRRDRPPQWQLGLPIRRWRDGYANPHTVNEAELRQFPTAQTVPYSPPVIFIPATADRRFDYPPGPVPMPLGKWEGCGRVRPEDIPGPRHVPLRPHQTWPWMATPLWQPRDGEQTEATMYRQIRALRAWLEAEEGFGQKPNRKPKMV